MTPELPEALRVAQLVIEVLGELGARHHLGGSYASSIHGTPRQTQDVDLVTNLSPEKAATLAVALQKRGFYADGGSARRALQRRSSFNVIHLESGVKVDIFARGDSPFDVSEFERATRIQAGGPDAVGVWVKSPEDTILRKLHWYRLGGEVSDRQWGDVLGCLRAQGEALDRGYLDRWARELEVVDLLEGALGEARA